MKFNWRNPFFILGLVIFWRVALLIFTVQPIPANDAFIFDGGMVNWLRTGHYVNPSIAIGYPISSGKVFSIYPPLYQLALLIWMPLCGTSAFSMVAMHVTMFACAASLVLWLVRKFFPGGINFTLVALLLFGITFNDRPEDLAHIFGICSLGLVVRQISDPKNPKLTALGITFFLLLALFTSIIVGAIYFGAGFLALAAAWFSRRKTIFFIPYFATAFLFAAIVFWVAKAHPLWWQGFLENGKKQSVVGGFHAPHSLEIVKLMRTAPVFLIAFIALPFFFAHRKQPSAEPWFFLTLGVFVMGAATLFLAMTLIAPDYVLYVVYLQIILAAGLLALAEKSLPEKKTGVQFLISACVFLVSIRAIGMTTWGAACAWKNSYWHTREELRAELEPFETSDAPVVISSAFLYSAAGFGVRHPIHSDWFYDRADYAPEADFDGIVKLHPAKLVLTQFDYYRSFPELLEKLRQHPELVSVQVRDESRMRTPDSIRSAQRIVQHISWAPVIVDLDWKN